MNKFEYWFLDAAIRLKIPLNWLSANNVDELLNRPHHHLSGSELLRVLERMFERGALFLEHVDRSGQRYRMDSPSRSEIEEPLYWTHDEWIRGSEQVFYGVTDRGGAAWEGLSHPRWEYFYDEGYGADPYEGGMTASTRQLIEERLALIPYDSSIKAIVPGSLRWSVLQPWQATYWKQLPIGYHVEFTYLPLTEADRLARSITSDRAQAWHQRVNNWYESQLNRLIS